jgi:geranylgeranyl diphosphate synthase type 3
LNSIKEIVSMLHNSSLLIDDIEDSSAMRRGRPVAHTIYGEASTINCANYVYFQAMDMCRALKNTAAMNVMLDEMLNLHRGQGLDIYWRDNMQCPSIQEYEGMVLDKTGGLFRLSLNLMQAFSTNQTNYTELADKMALFFQIRDDYVNLTHADYMKLKDFCEDLTEGKFSFPIIHSILARPDDHRLLAILKQRTSSVAIKKHAVEYMRECGSFDVTLQRLTALNTEIEEMIAALGGNPVLSKIQGYLCKDVLVSPDTETTSTTTASTSSTTTIPDL